MLIQSGPDSWASESLRRIRERCRDDLLFLVAEFLGQVGVETGQYARNLMRTPCRFHREAAEVVERGENALILAPRIHLKTALITVGGTVQSLLKDPNHRNLLISETPTLVSKVLREILWHFRENERLRHAFPEHRIDAREEDGTKTTFDSPCRTGPAKDYSIEAIGVGGATAGGHFDTIRATDILSNRTVPPEVTEETMLKTWNFIRGMGSLLDKTKKRSHMIIEGTVWHGADAYCQMMSDPGYRHFRKVVYGPWERDEKRELVLDAEGRKKPLWPEAYSREELERIRGELGEYLWSCNFENDPQPDPAEAMFKPSYFRHYLYGEPGVVQADGIPRVLKDMCPCCGKGLVKATTVDPAIGKKSKNDRTAMVTSGVCPHGSLVVVSTKAQRVEPGVMVEDFYAIDAVDRPDWIGVETVAFQKLFLYILHEESKKPGRYALNLRELKADAQKERRIGMLAAYARSRGVWVRPGDHDELVDECLKMTLSGSVGRHDDIVDALAYRLQWMGRPADAVEEKVLPRALYGASVLKGADVLDLIERKGRRGGLIGLP